MRGNEGKERRLCTLPVEGGEGGGGGNPQLFSIITCFDGKSCLYPQNRTYHSLGSGFVGFPFLLQHGIGH